MTVRYWQNVDIDVESARAAAQTIISISKANPGVVTHHGSQLTNGDYALMSVQGMRELHNRIARAANSAAGSPPTFQVEGVNTAPFGTFTEGTIEEITFGTSLNTITGVTASGGDPEFDDQTTVHDDIRVQAPTVNSPFQISMESIWDPADAGLLALKAASDLKVAKAVRVTFADGAKIAFLAYIACTMIPTGQAPGKVTTSITFTSLGRPDVWSD